MNRLFNKIVLFILISTMLFAFMSCGNKTDYDNLWTNAAYQNDAVFGEGSKVVTVKVVAGDKSINFTINTDKETLGDALIEHKLIAGEKGSYGLYVKSVNGIVADYDKNKAYWSIEKGGEYVTTGVDGIKISHNDCYEFIYVGEN